MAGLREARFGVRKFWKWRVAGVCALVMVLVPFTQFKPFDVHSAQDDAPKVVTSEAPASLERRESARALGRLEPASGLIVVGARPSSRIEQVLVKRGAVVEAGAVLAIQEGHAQAEKQLALAEALKKQAEHQLSLRRQKLKLEREQAEKTRVLELEAAQKVVTIAKQRFEMTTGHYKGLGANTADHDRFELDTNYFDAETQAIRAIRDMTLLEGDKELRSKQRALEDQALAEKGPEADVLQRQIELAEAGAAQTEVRAPSAGRVLEVFVHAGEVSSGPLLSLGDTESMVAIAEVYQTDVPLVSVGDPAEVRVLDQTVAGKVTEIGLVVGRNQVASLDPRAVQDRRVVKVTIQLDKSALAARLVNLEVSVLIKRGNPVRGPRARTSAASR